MAFCTASDKRGGQQRPLIKTDLRPEHMESGSQGGGTGQRWGAAESRKGPAVHVRTAAGFMELFGGRRYGGEIVATAPPQQPPEPSAGRDTALQRCLRQCRVDLCTCEGTSKHAGEMEAKIPP